MPDPNMYDTTILVPMVWCGICGSFIREKNSLIMPSGKRLCKDYIQCAVDFADRNRPIGKKGKNAEEE